MQRTLVSILIAALVALGGLVAEAKTRLSKTTYMKPTTAALKTATYLIIHAQNSSRPEAAIPGQRLGFVKSSKYLKLGPMTASASGATQRIVVQTRRSVSGVGTTAPLGEITVSVRPVKQGGKIIGWKAYNGADPANKIAINR
jgi:hypothetical protein